MGLDRKPFRSNGMNRRHARPTPRVRSSGDLQVLARQMQFLRVPVDAFGDGCAAVADQARDVFEVDVVGAEQADEGVPELSRRPLLSEPGGLGGRPGRPRGQRPGQLGQAAWTCRAVSSRSFTAPSLATACSAAYR